MKQRILSGWNAQRWLRLAFAIVFLFAGISGHEPVAYVAAVFFGAQAVFGLGCCGINTCVPSSNKTFTQPMPTTEITYEEIR